MKNVLFHQCCAPCFSGVLKLVQSQCEFSGYWFNPNIYPLTEYQSRKGAIEQLSKTQNFSVVYEEEQSYESWKNFVLGYENRCLGCYKFRLNKTAKKAQKLGFDSFSTTLLISPYQKHELIIDAAKDAAVEYGIEFYYKDFRSAFYEGKNYARSLGLYIQKYCGCEFSYAERFGSLK